MVKIKKPENQRQNPIIIIITPETVSCLWLDLMGMHKDQPLQGGVYVRVKTAEGSETNKEWQDDP